MATFENGSGEPFTASRIPALAEWLASASAPEPPAAPLWTSAVAPSSPATSAPMVPPTSGRATVWTTSQVLSTSGTLSATNSIANSTSDTTRTSVRANAAGSSIRSARWLRHISATVA